MLKKTITWWVFIVAGMFILCLALFLRLKNLTLLPIFADEAIYIRWAQVMKAESTLRFLPLSDGKQPLFMWSVIPLLKVISDPLISGRLVSALTGMGSLVGIGFLAHLLFKSKKISLLAAFLYTVSPYSVFFDRMALVDSMLSMFGIWSLILAILTARLMRLDLAMFMGFSLGAALLTKSPAIFFQILLPTSWLLASWPKKLVDKVKRGLKLGLLFAVAYLISTAMFNLLRLGPNFHLLKSRNYDYVYPINHIFVNFIDPFVPHLKDVLVWLRYFGPAILLPLGVFGIIVGFKKYFKETLVLTVFVFLPLLTQSMYAKVFTARYLYFVIPYVLILSSLVFLVKSKALNLCFYFVLIIFSFLALRQDFYLLSNPEKMALPRGERTGYLEEWTAGQGIKETAVYLRNETRNLPAGRQVVVGTDGYFGTLPDGLQIYLNDLPVITVVGVGVSFLDVPKPLIESAKAGNKTYLLVNSSRFFIQNPEERGLHLIKSYPKVVKPDRTNESLLFFQVSSAR